MSTFSKVAIPSDWSDDDLDLDVPGRHISQAGSEEHYPTTPLSKMHSGPRTGRNPSVSSRPRSVLVDENRRPILSRPSGSAGYRQRSRASEDRRSHSYIEISSDEPNATEIELTTLRKENKRLKIHCARLEGQIIALR
jgi:hypothetical protein